MDPVDIEKLIEKSGLSISAFSREIGVDRSTVYRWLAGETQPKGAALRAVLLKIEREKPFDPGRVGDRNQRIEMIRMLKRYSWEVPPAANAYGEEVSMFRHHMARLGILLPEEDEDKQHNPPEENEDEIEF